MSDAPTLLYLEADDEITAVVRRVRAADPGRVVVVAPGRSRATSSVVALRLLARTGEDEGRELSVVGDALTRSLAAEAGLTAYASVEDARLAREAADGGETRHAAIHVVRGPAAEETAPAMAAVVRSADTETRPVPVVPVPPKARPRRTRPAAGRRPGALVAVLGLAAAFLVIATVLGAMFLPAATIAITPRSEPVGPVTYRIRIEAPERIAGTVTETATVTATGSYAIQAAASGSVVFLNWNFVPVEVEAGSLVAAGEQAFGTTDTVVVPPGELTGDGTIRAGEQAVAVVAAAIGPAANVPAEAIDTILDQQTRNRLRGFPNNPQRLVVNPEATAGGADTSGIEITQADVDAAVQSLRDALSSSVHEALEGSDDGLFADPAEPAQPVISGTDGLVGTRDTEQAEIGGELAYDRLTAERDEVVARAQEEFLADPAVLPDGHDLLTDAIVVELGAVTREEDVLVVTADVSGRSAPQLSRGEVVQRVIGLTPEQAQAALAGLGRASVDLWPGWVATVPDREWRIDVRISGVEAVAPVPEPSGS